MDTIDILILLLITIAVLLIAHKLVCKDLRQYVGGFVGGSALGGEYKLNRKLMPIMTPEFNMREVAKQCILLEEHLNQKAKTCLDCQKKHFLTVEGLIEEAVSLDKKQKYVKQIPEWVRQWIQIEKDYVNKKKSFEELAQDIRKFRKPIMYEFFETVKDYNI